MKDVANLMNNRPRKTLGLVLKWSGKFGQRAKMYPTLMNGYGNDEETELFRQV
jgi:hypothetical protein